MQRPLKWTTIWSCDDHHFDDQYEDDHFDDCDDERGSLWKSVAVCDIRGATCISFILVAQCKLPPVAVVWVCLSYSSSGAAGDVITS